MAGKVTIGLVSNWPHVTDINGFPPMEMEMSTCLRFLSGVWLTYLFIMSTFMLWFWK